MTLLITGGASGIGAATAKLAAQRGHKVAINYRSRDAQAKKVVADITAKGGQAVALPADVSREADIVSLFDAAEKALGPITHLVNSAGIGLNSRVADFDAAALERLFTVNTVGLMLCCREAARRMSTKRGGKGGVVVNVSSMAGTIGGRPGASAYAASKAGVISLVQTTAYSLSGTGVRINAVCPGLIETGMTKPVFDRAKERGTDGKIGQLNPLKRAGQPHELAAMGLFLASDEASYVNGQAIPVDGGLTASMPYAGKPV